MLGYWERRSKCYNCQRWVTNRSYLEKFVRCGNFQKSDEVLDVGTGTGRVAKAMAPLVNRVVAIDTSESMLNLARENNGALNVDYQNMDVRELTFVQETFNKVTARMVFHHIFEGADRAVLECYRVLKKGGMLVFSEGVPPDERVKPQYDEVFKLKEERVTFMPEDIVSLLTLGGFRDIKHCVYWMRNMSVKEWLENSCINENLGKIILLHTEADDHFKDVYNMRITPDDVYIDWKFIIATGIKPR